MITIKQLAAELGLSKQAIYNRITKEPLKSALADSGCIPQTSQDGTIFLDDKCANAIREVYAKKYSGPDSSPIPGGYGRKRAKNGAASDEAVKVLLEQIENIQTMMSATANLANLQNELNQKEIEVAKLYGTVNALKDIVAQKDAQLNRLYEKYTEAVSHIKLFQAQILSLKKQLTPKEPPPDVHNAFHLAK